MIIIIFISIISVFKPSETLVLSVKWEYLKSYGTSVFWIVNEVLISGRKNDMMMYLMVVISNH